MYKPTPSSSAMNVVGNLTSTREELRDFDPWMIDMAHRLWSISADYPNESEVWNYLPENNETQVIEYMKMQLGDQRRSIADLETYNKHLLGEIVILKRKLEEAERDAASVRNV